MFDFLKPKEIQKKPVKIIPLSELHTGGTTALFPFYNGKDLGFPPHPKMTGDNGGWKFKHITYTPTSKQYQMFQHFTRCAETIKEQRGNSRFIVVENGDSVEGNHHHTIQLATHTVSEQITVHVWLMQYFLHKIGFDKNKGDLLYIGEGTEAHTEDDEDSISQLLGAETLPGGEDTFGFMPMDVNGRRFWFLHQGAAAGKDLNKGNALHNWMRGKYFSSLESKRTIPDCVVMGHYHSNVYDTFTRNEMTIQGIILPPWQLKTRFGYRVAAAELEEVGIRTIDVSGEGDIRVNKPMRLGFPDDVVTI